MAAAAAAAKASFLIGAVSGSGGGALLPADEKGLAGVCARAEDAAAAEVSAACTEAHEWTDWRLLLTHASTSCAYNSCVRASERKNSTDAASSASGSEIVATLSTTEPTDEPLCRLFPFLDCRKADMATSLRAVLRDEKYGRLRQD